MTKYPSLTNLTQEEKSKNPELESFFGKLFEVKNFAHLIHLRQPKLDLATHLSLGDFYEQLTNLADELIESYQGAYGLVNFSFTVPSTQVDCCDYIQNFFDYLTKTKIFIKPEDSWLLNQKDEITQLTAKTLFKLKYVK